MVCRHPDTSVRATLGMRRVVETFDRMTVPLSVAIGAATVALVVSVLFF
jgi:hypothetical protein